MDGNAGYEFMALGRGAMAGVNVFWGPAPRGSVIPGLRRVKVAIGSEVLWRHYADGGTAHSCALAVLEQLRGDLVENLPPTRAIRVRRVDVCIDHWGYAWSGVDLTRFVCRQTSRGLEERAGRKKRGVQLEDVGREVPIEDVDTHYGKKSATYYVGARGSGSRYLRVYNKVVEAADSGKLPWMEPAWRAAGWDGKATVWRAEIEHGGDWLNDHGFDTLDKLEGCERALWRAYLDDVRHVSTNRTRAKRCATSRVWLCLRGSIRRAERIAKKDQLHTAWTWQPRPPRIEGDCETLTAMAGGLVNTLEARLFRCDSDKPEDIAAKKDALWEFLQQASARCAERKAKRGAKRALRARPPPEPPPPSRHVAARIAALEQRGAELAAEFERTHVPKHLRGNHARPDPDR